MGFIKVSWILELMGAAYEIGHLIHKFDRKMIIQSQIWNDSFVENAVS